MKKKEQKTHPKHALLIEDNKPCQIIMTHSLQQLNYKVDLVDEGKKAVRMAQDKLYDLIISDVRIEGLSGEEVIPLLRESKNEDTVIIVWSAFVNKKNELRYLIWQADAALTKPCTIDDLKITIEECLKRRRIESESFDRIEKIKEKWLECGGQINFFEKLIYLPYGQLCILIDVIDDLKITIEECLKHRRIKSESFDRIEKIKEKWLECGGQINFFEKLIHLPHDQLCTLIDVLEDIKGNRQWEYLSRSAIREN